MSHTIRVGRRHRTGRAGRAALAAGSALLMAAAAASCTAEPPEQSRAESAPSTAAAVPLLEDQPATAPLAPGRYVVSVFDAPSSAPLAPVLQVPAGYTNAGGAGVLGAGRGEVGHRVVWLWDIRSVYTHPCDAGGYPEPVGPSVTDLASALAAQPMREGTDPVPVTIDGHDGLYVELSTSDDLDFATCREGYFHSWPGRADRAPGSMDLLWIIDVEGQRVTFDLSYPSTATPEQVEELKEIVTTATFTRRQDS